MKRLILMRHAKTEPWNEGVKDRDRILTPRGHGDAEAVAVALQQYGWAPDRALISSSRRTRETWRHLSLVFPECEKVISDDLYLAGIPAIETQIAAQADAGTLIVIGHNPGLHELSGSILRQAGSDNHQAAMRLAAKFPTSAAALFEQEEDGPYVPVHFKLQTFIKPKSLA
ncbi:SixA phosphatase family protein [Henriciella aquimarina]|uniref:SixA phosphatase family protein n=1 Tax=Henriciella aquimarina TaxID=545261 RepID=UPI0009FE3494|nr:histidine phosphatase family protein [Henriciella aquimarina]